MTRPLMMLTNDDGWDSVGLRASWRAVKDLASIIIVAPDSHMSGVGKAVTILRPLKLTTFSQKEMTGYKIDGTPADCVIIGLHKITEVIPDLLISGINLGPNLGLDDLTSSGTMGACLQAAMYGIPSICVSYCLNDYAKKITLSDLSLSMKVVNWVTEWVLQNGMPEDVDVIILAVPEARGNTPEVKATRLALSPLPDIHFEKEKGTYSFMSRTLELYSSQSEDDDVNTVLNGNISITPFSLKHHLRPTKHIDPLIQEINQRKGRG